MSINNEQMINWRPDYTTMPLKFSFDMTTAAATITFRGSVFTFQQYSFKNDGTGWTSITNNTPINIPIGSYKIYFKGSNYVANTSSTTNTAFTFTGLSNIKISGNIASLSNYVVTSASYKYKCLFKDQVDIVDASNLYNPGTVATYMYYQMFMGCTGLKHIPKKFLPATLLTTSDSYCYYSFAEDCINLETTCNLPAYWASTPPRTGYLYARMYYNCPKLNISDIKFGTFTSMGSGTSQAYLFQNTFYLPEVSSTRDGQHAPLKSNGDPIYVNTTTNTTNTAGCFANNDGLTDYASIPTTWK
jgi:hypothetical protein